MGSKKEGTHICFVPNIVPKKMGSKKMLVKKKINLSFLDPNIVPEKSMTAQKRMSSEKKGTHIFSGKKKHIFEGIFLPVFFPV